MTSDEMFNEVQCVFQTVFEDDALTISRETTAEDVQGWDSFAHVNLIMALEMKFGMTFKLAEVQELNCVGDMIDVISRKVGVAG